MKKALFIDRDGTILIEPEDFQIYDLSKFKFYPKVIQNLVKIAKETDYELVLVSNQDGLGTASFPEETFWPCQNMMLSTLESEGFVFDNILIDRSMPEENAPTRKPRTGMLTEYSTGYLLEESYVIGDRLTDVQFAKNLGCKSILLSETDELTADYVTTDWDEVYRIVSTKQREVSLSRKTKETEIDVRLTIDGTGKAEINTGLRFFDHMLEQFARHSLSDVVISVKGDLDVDEHHTIEDTAITLGEAILHSLGDKVGIERYGFMLPMDDCLAQVALDFSGRSWIEWDAEFKREKVGDMPTEMFFHFFK